MRREGPPSATQPSSSSLAQEPQCGVGVPWCAESRSWGGSWVTWPWGLYTSDMTQGHFPHPSGWPSACLPSLADVPAKGPFLAPGLFFLPGGSSGERAGAAAQGAGEKWKQGPQGCLPVPTSLLCQGCQGSGTGAQPLCSVEMKRTLSSSCNWWSSSPSSSQ